MLITHVHTTRGAVTTAFISEDSSASLSWVVESWHPFFQTQYAVQVNESHGCHTVFQYGGSLQPYTGCAHSAGLYTYGAHGYPKAVGPTAESRNGYGSTVVSFRTGTTGDMVPLKTDDRRQNRGDDNAAAPSHFGIGIYTDTPGSPAYEAQLDAALDLVGERGWVTIFLCAWRTHTSNYMNKTTTHDPESTAMLEAAYGRKLNVVARIGNPWAPRDHAHDASHTSFGALAAAYGRLVSSLPPPPDDAAPLHVWVGNELNACNEWQCSGPPSVNMSSAQMAQEVAAFVRDVVASLAPLHNGSGHVAWPAVRLRVGHAPISNWDSSPCQCGTEKPLGGGRSGLQFLQAMLDAVPDLYPPASVDWLSSHAYPYSGEPFGTDRAVCGLTYYQNEIELVGRGGTMPTILTETG